MELKTHSISLLLYFYDLQLYNGAEFITRAFDSILVAWLLHQWKHTSSLNILNTRKNTLLTARFFPLSEQAADIIFLENHIGTFKKKEMPYGHTIYVTCACIVYNYNLSV